ncbi:universal stress protein [Sanyastnella coralliicola]|uniref:universal stress protein n=1 Tax=Sanyastnella coralliicola TaxID=3069118 RepID=UPI0027BA58F1|nr:universal stress protein [Longitalea sp. SCSIO 12813]
MKILIPIDFSENAKVALRYAMLLFGDESPEVVLLNTWQVPHTGTGMLVSIDDLLRDESEKGMAEAVATLRDELHDSIKLSGRVHQGGVIDVIKTIMRTEDYDLIVMGTHGADDVKKKLLGSNTSNVIRGARIPVLAVPLDTELSTPALVSLATDFENIKEDQAMILRRIVRKFRTKFHAVNVQREAVTANGVPDTWQTPFNGDMPEMVQLVADDVVSGIDAYMKDNEVDLLAVIRHDYGFFEGIFHKSVSRSLSMYTNKPVLVIPEG